MKTLAINTTPNSATEALREATRLGAEFKIESEAGKFYNRKSGSYTIALTIKLGDKGVRHYLGKVTYQTTVDVDGMQVKQYDTDRGTFLKTQDWNATLEEFAFKIWESAVKFYAETNRIKNVVCLKCNGTGHIKFYSYYAGGVCFDCNGKGIITK